ncbi:hypothetical protein [Flavobacterium psychrolimnae]|uniref:TerB family tellurite resistance protein n=1 Tax=Flavobacterium psychrolimnae TaxID=249351 RepID=A0A366AX54_9FLAO|nr:hypothetical protein [Flavobacterium psychrolimnae]RBN49452.1 hypothetical protein DR980_13495 [Flavobacterium psychrolimnae]
MKKIAVLILLIGLFNVNMRAQAKQREELLKQIAAFQVYIGYAQKGYSFAKKGLSVIGDFKRGELDLHLDYFNSLININPKIKNYSRVAQIIALQVKILKSYSRTMRYVKQNDLFHGDEVAYVKRVLDRLLKDCDGTVDELTAVLTKGKLELKDDERLEKIDALYQNMLESESFCEDFSNQTRMMGFSRSAESKDVQTSHALQGLKDRIP